MHLMPELLVATAVVAVSVPTGRMLKGEPAPPAPVVSMIRFTNTMTTNATVSANGTVLFADVPSTRTTGWAQVKDSTVTFTLTVSGQEGQTATATESLVEGAQYTVTAAPGTEGRPVLTVKREAPNTAAFP